MAIDTLPADKQEALIKHGHYSYWEIATYDDDSTVTVECTKCGEVLVELIGGREQEGG
jgi:hypothetical protein